MRSDEKKKLEKLRFCASVLLPTITEFHCFVFILLSRESEGGAVHRMNSDWLRSCPCFRVFQLSFHSLPCCNGLSIIISLQPEKMFSISQ